MEELTKVLLEEKRRQQGETLSVLDMLRKTRASRGGTGAPLEIPGHLKDAASGHGIIITDADLNAGLTKVPIGGND